MRWQILMFYIVLIIIGNCQIVMRSELFIGLVHVAHIEKLNKWDSFLSIMSQKPRHTGCGYHSLSLIWKYIWSRELTTLTKLAAATCTAQFFILRFSRSSLEWQVFRVTENTVKSRNLSTKRKTQKKRFWDSETKNSKENQCFQNILK